MRTPPPAPQGERSGTDPNQGRTDERSETLAHLPGKEVPPSRGSRVCVGPSEKEAAQREETGKRLAVPAVPRRLGRRARSRSPAAPQTPQPRVSVNSLFGLTAGLETFLLLISGPSLHDPEVCVAPGSRGRLRVAVPVQVCAASSGQSPASRSRNTLSASDTLESRDRIPGRI